MMKKALTMAACAFVAASFTSQAEVRINGFANFIGGITGSDDTLYGYDEDLNFDSESLFAIQISGDVNSKVTATGQLVARGIDDYDPDFEWAYLTYAATDNTSISVGRLRLPLFRYSASSDVGYSYHWVTAPRAIYDVIFSNLDGVRVDYNNYSGDWEYNVQVAYGTFSGDTTSGTFDGDNVFLVSGEATYDWFKVRAVAGRATNEFASDSINPLFDQLDAIGLNDVADGLRVEDDTGTFLGLGVEVDKFTWFVSGEVTVTETDDAFFGEDTSYYLTAGWRIGQFTPSITYESKDDNDDIKFVDRIAGLPAELQAAATGIIVGVQSSTREEYDQLTLGLRYDYDAGLALKADISKYSDDINDANDATLVRVGVNYVF